MPTNGHSLYRTEEEVINALFQTHGIIRDAARALKLASVKELRDRINKNPELKTALLEAREQALDMAEGIIHKAMKSGTTKNKLETAKWYLARKGRNRGYGDVTTNINANFNVDLVEKAKKIPLEKRLEILEYLDADATDVE